MINYDLFSSSKRMLSCICLIVISSLIFGCGPSSEDEEFRQMTDSTRNKYNPSDVRKVALPLFFEYKNHTNSVGDSIILLSDIPQEIKNLPLFSKNPNIVSAWSSMTDSNLLVFETGSGFGHWGIAICRDQNDVHLLKFPRNYTTWGDGIYFYRGE